MNKMLDRTRRSVLDGPDTPPWWTLVQIALGVGFVLFLLVSLRGDPAPLAGGPPTDPGVTAPPTAPTAPTEPGPTVEPAPTAPAGGGMASVDAADGGQVEVPAESLTMARTAVEALFTGDFSAVSFVAGTSAPPVGATWPAPEIGDVQVRVLSDTLLQFVFTVDPDGDGPEAARRVTVHVADTGAGWAFRGA